MLLFRIDIISLRSTRLADLALHSTTTTDTIPAVNTIAASSAYAYGTEMNTTAFENYLDLDGNAHPSNIQEGISTAENRSTVNQVFSIGSMAYVARLSSSIPGDISFMASSFGVESQCSSITHQCFNATQAQDLISGYNCSDAGYDWIAGDDITTILTGPTTTYGPDSLQTFANLTNPFPFFYQNWLPQPSNAYQFGELLLNNSMNATLRSEYEDYEGSYLLMACNISLYDLTLQYTRGDYTIVNKTLRVAQGSDNQVAILSYPLAVNETHYNSNTIERINVGYPMFARLAADIENLASFDAPEFIQAVSPDVARLLLSYSAGLLQPSNAAIVAKDGVVARYRIAALATYMLLVYIYALVAFVIFTWASFGCISIPAEYRDERIRILEQARNFISQPSALVAELFDERKIDAEEWAVLDDRAKLRVGFKTAVIGQDDDEEMLSYGVWMAEMPQKF